MSSPPTPSTPPTPPTRRGRQRRLLLFLTPVAVLAAGGAAALGMHLWVGYVAAPYLFQRLADVPPRTVAIVPGAMVHTNGQPSAALEDRLLTALDLYRAGRVAKILISGDHGAPEYDEVNAMHRWMLEKGVPEADVFLDHAGLRTLDTMERAARVFEVRDAVVCTQEFHLARAVFLGRRAGIDAVGLVADRRAYWHEGSNRAREVGARVLAFVDSYVLHRGPRHLGAPIPITGDGRATHDRWTATR